MEWQNTHQASNEKSFSPVFLSEAPASADYEARAKLGVKSGAALSAAVKSVFRACAERHFGRVQEFWSFCGQTDRRELMRAKKKQLKTRIKD